MRSRAIVGGCVVTVLLAGLGVYVGLRQLAPHLPLPSFDRGCTVEAGGQVRLDPEQMANAATIAAIGVRRKMPERAVLVALATAFQESRLRNLTGGDRDSIGLFQQRPSQGWGPPEKLQDPRYSSSRFYAALRKVRGWEQMRVTDAAQAVQRSAYPEAYQQWVEDAEVLTRALLGTATGAVACTLGREPALRGGAATAALSESLTLDWGLKSTPTAQTGLTLPAADSRTGWRYAHWLVAQADDHGVKRVRFEELEWTATGGKWAPVTNGAAGNGLVLAEVFAET